MDALVTQWNGLKAPDNSPVSGPVFLNPPYSKLPAFFERAYEQSLEHPVPVVLLVPAYTETKYWASYATKAHEIRFLKGRLSFLEGGQTKSTARFPSALVIFKSIPGTHYGKSPNIWTWDYRCAVPPNNQI